MPYISVKTPFEAKKEVAVAVKAKLGKAIELLPSKTERWLMVSFDKQDAMFFAGEEKPCAMVEIALFGASTEDAYEKLTAAVCRIINKEMGVEKNAVYVKYSEVKTWGWNGGNF